MQKSHQSSLVASREIVGWHEASTEAKEWWCELEKVNHERSELVVELAEELKVRRATVDDFFLVCAYSGREGVRENLRFLDLVHQDSDMVS